MMMMDAFRRFAILELLGRTSNMSDHRTKTHASTRMIIGTRAYMPPGEEYAQPYWWQ
jgi:hypothetical protein